MVRVYFVSETAQVELKVDECKPKVDECKPLPHRSSRSTGREDSAPAPTATPPGRGLHSFTSELNLSNSGTHSRVRLGLTVDRSAQVEM